MGDLRRRPGSTRTSQPSSSRLRRAVRRGLLGDGDQDRDVAGGSGQAAGGGKRGRAVEHDPDGRCGGRRVGR